MRTLRYPLTLNGAGKTSTTIDPLQTVRDQITVLLATNPGERPEDLDYGSDVSALLFQAEDDIEDAAGEAITNALQTYLEGVLIDQVIVDQVDDETGRVAVEVSFIASDVADSIITLIEG